MPAGPCTRTFRSFASISALVWLVAASSAARAGGALQLPDGRWVHIAPGSAPAAQTNSGDPSAPAAQDSFAIYGGPGTLAGKFQQSTGAADRQGWVGIDLSALPPVSPFGDFSKVVSLASEPDACQDSASPAMAFLDDGTPPSNHPGQSTGGETSTAWTYGVPGGYVVNHSGGLGAPGTALRNEVWSPEIAWDVSTTTADDAIAGGLTLRYLLWEHLPLRNGIFHTWRVRSFPHPTSGGWSEWRDRGFVYYGATPNWRVREVEIGDLLVPLPQKVQVALGAVDLSAQLGVAGNDATPSPVFDDVALIKHDVDGPLLTVREIDQFHDGFPRSGHGTGAPTLADLALRMDIARDINPAGALTLTGDSMVVQVTATLPGASLTGPPVLTWFLRPNALFDAVRQLPSSAVPVPNGWKGTVTGAPVLGTGGLPAPGLWWFDLPDGPRRNPRVLVEPDEPRLVFPGDKLWIYIEAHDTQGHTSFWIKDPSTGGIPSGELCGGGEAGPGGAPIGPQGPGKKPPRDPPQPKEPEPDGLPGIWEGGIGKGETTLLGIPVVQPRVLVWDDTGEGEDLVLFAAAMGQIGLLRGRDFDVYTTLAAGSGVGNGLGASFAHGATAAQLEDYDIVFYLGGEGPALSDGTDQSGNDKSDDLALLAAWRAQPGHRSMAYFADDIGTAAQAQGSLTLDYLLLTQAVIAIGDDVAPAVDGQEIVAVAPSGLGSSLLSTRFAIDGSCPDVRRFDHLLPRSGSSAVVSHRFLTRSGDPIVGPAAAVWHSRLQNVGGTNWRRLDVTFPFAFAAVRDDVNAADPGAAVAARARLLRDLLTAFGHPTVPGDAMGGPAPRAMALQVGAAFPNPFNATSTLSVRLESPRVLRARVLDARGRLVRELLAPTPTLGAVDLVWHGDDAKGAPVGSGVYSIEVEAGQQREHRRVVLAK